jgi:hypothetical protein
MWKPVMVSLGALALAGCGGGKAAMVKSCVDDGTDRKTCDCIASELERKLDKDVFDAMVLGAQGRDEAAKAAMDKLPIEKQFSIATGAMSAAMTCGLN